MVDLLAAGLPAGSPWPAAALCHCTPPSLPRALPLHSPSRASLPPPPAPTAAHTPRHATPRHATAAAAAGLAIHDLAKAGAAALPLHNEASLDPAVPDMALDLRAKLANAVRRRWQQPLARLLRAGDSAAQRLPG
jgi:hypothetical protein